MGRDAESLTGALEECRTKYRPGSENRVRPEVQTRSASQHVQLLPAGAQMCEEDAPSCFNPLEAGALAGSMTISEIARCEQEIFFHFQQARRDGREMRHRNSGP